MRAGRRLGTRERKKAEGIRVKRWWALVNSPGDLPCVFETRQQAIENCCDDEYLVQIWVVPARVRDRDVRQIKR